MNASQLTEQDDHLRGLVCYSPDKTGCLLISGPDRAAFLQRQTTNDVRLLAPGQAVLTVLTSPTGRILDVFYLFVEQVFPGEDSIYVLPLPGHAAQTYQFLKSRIFFMDQVTITDISDRVSTIDVFGPESARALAGLGLGTLPAPGTTQTVSTGPYHLVCLGLDQSISLGWRVIFPTDQQPTLIDRLDSLGGHFLDVSAYERLRIEKGLPGAGSELVEEYTPLEAGLAQAVSQSKGCYTGQEVLARQINYEKITQTLCGLKLDRPLAPGQALYKDGQPAGRLTSITKSGRLGWIGLGVIKRPHNQEGTLLSTSSSDQADGLWVCALPFTTNQLI